MTSIRLVLGLVLCGCCSVAAVGQAKLEYPFRQYATVRYSIEMHTSRISGKTRQSQTVFLEYTVRADALKDDRTTVKIALDRVKISYWPPENKFAITKQSGYDTATKKPIGNDKAQDYAKVQEMVGAELSADCDALGLVKQRERATWHELVVGGKERVSLPTGPSLPPADALNRAALELIYLPLPGNMVDKTWEADFQGTIFLFTLQGKLKRDGRDLQRFRFGPKRPSNGDMTAGYANFDPGTGRMVEAQVNYADSYQDNDRNNLGLYLKTIPPPKKK